MLALCLLFLTLPLAQAFELSKCQMVPGYLIIGIENAEDTGDDELERMKQAAKELILRLPIGTGPGQTRVMVKSFDEEVIDILGDDTHWIEEPPTADELDDAFSEIEAGSFASSDIPKMLKYGIDVLEPLEDWNTAKTQMILFLNDENDGGDAEEARTILWNTPNGYVPTIHVVVGKPLEKDTNKWNMVKRLVYHYAMYLDSEHVVRDAHMTIMDHLVRNCLACPKPPKVDLTILFENYQYVHGGDRGVYFEPLKNITRDVVSRFSRHGFNDIQYGVIQYGDQIDAHLNLTDRAETVEQFITSLKYQSTERDLGKALKYVVENTMNPTVTRPDAKKIVLIISSLEYVEQFDEEVAKYAKMARDEGMMVMFNSLYIEQEKVINQKLTQMAYSIQVGDTWEGQRDFFISTLNQKVCIMGRYY